MKINADISIDEIAELVRNNNLSFNKFLKAYVSVKGYDNTFAQFDRSKHIIEKKRPKNPGIKPNPPVAIDRRGYTKKKKNTKKSYKDNISLKTTDRYSVNNLNINRSIYPTDML